LIGLHLRCENGAVQMQMQMQVQRVHSVFRDDRPEDGWRGDEEKLLGDELAKLEMEELLPKKPFIFICIPTILPEQLKAVDT
jgi:hypothetical protein